MSRLVPIECRVVDTDKLVPNPFQPRESFDKESIGELAKSLKARGEIQPIVVTEKKGRYVIIAGERRWRAAKMARLSKIPIVIRDVPEDDILLDSLVENLHRKDLASTEREGAFHRLWVDYGKEGKKLKRWKTIEEMAEELGIDHWTLNQNLLAYDHDKKYHIREKAGHQLSTSDVYERGTALEAAEKVKSAPLKRELLKPKPRVTPKVIKKIARELPEEKHEQVVRTIQAMRLEEEEQIAHVEAAKIEQPVLTKERVSEIRKNFEETERQRQRILSDPETKKRGELFTNSLSHETLESVIGSAFCPVGEKHHSTLVWKCHDLEVTKASGIAHKKLEEALKATSQ